MKLILVLLVLVSWTFQAQGNQMVTSNGSDITIDVYNELQTDNSNASQVSTDQESYNKTHNPLTAQSDSYTTETIAAGAPIDSSNSFPTDSLLPTDSTTMETILESETTLPSNIYSIVHTSPNRYSTEEISINIDSPILTENNNQMETVTVSNRPHPADTTVAEKYSSLQTESSSYRLTETFKVASSTLTSDSASEDQPNESSNSMESVQGDTLCVVYEILREAGMIEYHGLNAADWICVIKNVNAFKPNDNSKVRCRKLESQKSRYPCKCFGNDARKYIQCYMTTVRDPADLWNNLCKGKDLRQYTRGCASQLPQKPRQY